MFVLSCRIAAGLHTTLRSRAPTNRLVARLRTSHERQRAMKTAVCAIPAYVITAILCTGIADGGPGVLGGAAAVGVWNSMKIAWAVVIPVREPTFFTGWR